MKILEIHIKNMECELPSKLPSDVTFQALCEIKNILAKYRISCDIDLVSMLPGIISNIKIDCVFDLDDKEDE